MNLSKKAIAFLSACCYTATDCREMADFYNQLAEELEREES